MKTKPLLREWIWLNLKIGALSFGSAGRALLYQDAVVTEKKWMTQDEFQEVFTLTQVLPGPNLGNLVVYLGYRLSGLGGAIAGLVSLAIPGALMLVSTYELLGLGNPSFESFFKGVSIGSIVLFLMLILKNAKGLSQSATPASAAPKSKIIARACIAVTIAGLALASVSMSKILLIGGALGLVCEFSGSFAAQRRSSC